MSDMPRLWHVVLTVGGAPQPVSEVTDALQRLKGERPFIDSVRFDENCAELCYWDEADEMVDAASLALRLWNEHRASADLPPWRVVGLEVVERETFQARHRGDRLTDLDAAAHHL